MEDRLKQLSKTEVSDIMIKDPLFTFSNEKISTTELLMVRKNIGGLPVVKDRKNKQLIGIITQRDIRLARFAMSLESPNTTVKDLMTPEPFVVKKDDTLLLVLETMFDKKVQRLPVVNDNNELIGLVLQNEILKILLEFIKK
ncbi:MAG: CBS domain-containing protein [Candidatus Hodarchaeota archaeon]